MLILILFACGMSKNDNAFCAQACTKIVCFFPDGRPLAVP